MSALRSGRTPDEVCHETALPLVEECTFGEACAFVVVGTKNRTAFRFVHCMKREDQIKMLREAADILEGKHGGMDLIQ